MRSDQFLWFPFVTIGLLTAGTTAHAVPKTGKTAPPFVVKTITGGTFELTRQRGKAPVLLNFFATW